MRGSGTSRERTCCVTPSTNDSLLATETDAVLTMEFGSKSSSNKSDDRADEEATGLPIEA